MGSDAVEKEKRKATMRSPPLMLIGVTVLMLMLPSVNDVGVDEGAPARITHIMPNPGESVRSLAISPSLRGCCGEPTEFQWVFLGPADSGVIGFPFQTRVVALDARGRQASSASCELLKVDVRLSGNARLSSTSSLHDWRQGELSLDIESDDTGVVDAEVRIENPNYQDNVLLHTTQIRFGGGPASEFRISLDSKDAKDKGTVHEGPWETDVQIEVSVTAQDKLGNPTSLSIQGTELDTSRFVDYHLLLLKTSGTALHSLTSGPLDMDDRRERGSAAVFCKEVGRAEMWLEHAMQMGVNVTRQTNEALREQTLRTVDCIAGPGHTTTMEWREPLSTTTEFLPGEEPPSLPTGFEPRRVKFGPPMPPGFAEKRGITDTVMSQMDMKWAPLAEEVRRATKHAWYSYRKRAWGRDEIRPIGGHGSNAYGGIGITILDSLSTLWLMGLTEEFEQGADFVEKRFNATGTNAQVEVSVFELIIRALGGLLSAHSLSGRPIFLQRAKELAERLLPAMNTPSHFPMPKWSLHNGTGTPLGDPTILAEAGSIQLELRYLSKHTGDDRFKRAGDASFEAIQETGMTGLGPVFLTPPETPQPLVVSSKFAVGGLADSYYEYLLKLWLQSPDEVRFKELWLTFLHEFPSLLRPRPFYRDKDIVKSSTKYKVIEVLANGEPVWKMEHLSCFVSGMIALGVKSIPASDFKEASSDWFKISQGIAQSCVDMWLSTKSGLAPEHVVIRPGERPEAKKKVPEEAQHSYLRPETVESLFYLYRFTGDEKYREQGKKIFGAIMKHAKVPGGFASVKDVNELPVKYYDEMHSFVMAETFKYLYLLFSPADVLSLDRYVLNTEGHPLEKFSYSNTTGE